MKGVIVRPMVIEVSGSSGTEVALDVQLVTRNLYQSLRFKTASRAI